MLLLVDATPELVAESRGAQKAQPIPVIAEVSHTHWGAA